MYSIIKRLIFACFPNLLLGWIKQLHYYRKLKHTLESEEEDLLLLHLFIREKTHVIDIGANIGLYTKFMSKYAGKDGRVISIEPIPETYNYLKNNIQKLKFENVTPLNVAISDKNGKVMMEVPKFRDNRENLYEAKIVDDTDNTCIHCEVETKTLNDVCNQYHVKPSFIKCDVEGHEWFVFKGADYILTNYKPALLVEINEDLTSPNLNTSSLLDFLNKKGYQIFIYKNNHLKPWENEKKFNYYFLTQEHINGISYHVKFSNLKALKGGVT
jgi:FkbM family methyltransferase